MNEFKAGALVICKGGTPNLAHQKFAGTVHRLAEVVCRDYLGEHWRLNPPTTIDGLNLQWTRQYLQLLDDPGEDAIDEMVERIGKPVAKPEGVTV
jgi:hypothetical protein